MLVHAIVFSELGYDDHEVSGLLDLEPQLRLALYRP